jgi:hypothetical protein
MIYPHSRSGDVIHIVAFCLPIVIAASIGLARYAEPCETDIGNYLVAQLVVSALSGATRLAVIVAFSPPAKPGNRVIATEIIVAILEFVVMFVGAALVYGHKAGCDVTEWTSAAACVGLVIIELAFGLVRCVVAYVKSRRSPAPSPMPTQMPIIVIPRK